MFVDSGKVTSTWGKEPPVMTTREELKKEDAREEWEKLIAHLRIFFKFLFLSPIYLKI